MLFVCNLYWCELAAPGRVHPAASRAYGRTTCRQVCPLNCLSSYSSDETYTRIPSGAGISIGDHLKFDGPESPFPCRINPISWPGALAIVRKREFIVFPKIINTRTTTGEHRDRVDRNVCFGAPAHWFDFTEICLEISQRDIRTMPVLNTESA